MHLLNLLPNQANWVCDMAKPIDFRLLTPSSSDYHLSRDTFASSHILFRLSSFHCGRNGTQHRNQRTGAMSNWQQQPSVRGSMLLLLLLCVGCWCHKSLSTTNIRWHSDALS